MLGRPGALWEVLDSIGSDWGLDELWCTAAKEYAPERPSCAYIREPVDHENSATIRKKVGSAEWGGYSDDFNEKGFAAVNFSKRAYPSWYSTSAKYREPHENPPDAIVEWVPQRRHPARDREPARAPQRPGRSSRARCRRTARCVAGTALENRTRITHARDFQRERLQLVATVEPLHEQSSAAAKPKTCRRHPRYRNASAPLTPRGWTPDTNGTHEGEGGDGALPDARGQPAVALVRHPHLLVRRVRDPRPQPRRALADAAAQHPVVLPRDEVRPPRDLRADGGGRRCRRRRPDAPRAVPGDQVPEHVGRHRLDDPPRRHLECVGYAPVVHGALPAPALVDLPDAQDATKMSAELSAAQLHVPTSQCSCHRPPCHTSSIHDPHAETCWHHVEGARMWARSHSDGLYHRDAPDIELQENLISLSVTNPLPGSFNCLRPCEPDEPEMGPSDDWLEIDTRPPRRCSAC